jgi:hypothetical protein
LNVVLTVNDAVIAAQQELTDAMLQSVDVDIAVERRLTRQQQCRVEIWLTQGPEISPREEQIVDGRHRTWGAKAAGAAVAPVLTSDMSDAIGMWVTKRGEYLGYPTKRTVNYWKSNLLWWRNSPEAQPWRDVNERHIEFFEPVIPQWQARLSKEALE